ncbi:hypothetical protein ABZZ17_24040 [Streptomyces sp. NPDC006512]|uniref:hypothetical protein n=1 Tax=Streptomyces sp. NPDC006512 TaxID=3154307 RepID=UPI0033AC4588
MTVLIIGGSGFFGTELVQQDAFDALAADTGRTCRQGGDETPQCPVPGGVLHRDRAGS